MNDQRLRVNAFLRPLARVAVGWEFVALIPGSPLPTISSLCVKHRWLGPVLVLAFTVHLVDMGMNAVVELVEDAIVEAVEEAVSDEMLAA
jgi:hypothetical protein